MKKFKKIVNKAREVKKIVKVKIKKSKLSFHMISNYLLTKL